MLMSEQLLYLTFSHLFIGIGFARDRLFSFLGGVQPSNSHEFVEAGRRWHRLRLLHFLLLFRFERFGGNERV